MEVCVKASKDNIDRVFELVDGALENTDGVSRKDILKLHMIVDEIFSNISNYAYGEEKGDVRVSFDRNPEDGTVSLVFVDDGVPYNPIEEEDPDVTLSSRERKIGGLGLFMVKKTVDDIRYENRDGKNILTLIKRTGGDNA